MHTKTGHVDASAAESSAAVPLIDMIGSKPSLKFLCVSRRRRESLNIQSESFSFDRFDGNIPKAALRS